MERAMRKAHKGQDRMSVNLDLMITFGKSTSNCQNYIENQQRVM